MVHRRFARSLLAAALVACGIAMTTSDLRAEEIISVMLDRATIIKTPDKAVMVVIGNPAIADVSVQKNGIMVLTGKSFGETNLLALDEKGQLISESWLRVQPSNRNIVVYRGAEPESYSCTPNCKPTISLGDSDKHFAKTGGQLNTRNSLATPEK